MSTQFALMTYHLDMLRTGSGISDAVIAARGYRTITFKDELRGLGFTEAQCLVPGLLIPVHTPDGGQPLYVYRPDHPRYKPGPRSNPAEVPPSEGHRSKVIKYEFPRGAAMRVDCPPPCRAQLGNPATPLWITEGQKKADALASQGVGSQPVCAIALLGVWNFKGRNEFGGSTVLADFDAIAWRDRDVRIVFDSDVMTKAPVQDALARLTAVLRNRGAHVTAVYLPPAEGGGKQGVDDYLAHGHTMADLERLAQAPRPARQAAPARIEVLGEEVDVMRQPIALIQERAYAAVWPLVRVEVSETVARNGEIVRYDPPRTKHERWLFIVRDDGKLFSETGAGADGSFADLGFAVDLPEAPETSRTWRMAAAKAYCDGERPAPVEVFRKVAANVSRFIDFDRSLAGQETMSELTACYIIATYFLPAFNVIGFLWANGDRGSGKTQLLQIVCEQAYLGQVILASGSFAALRDLADYGATLAFDDAENVSDPKLMDPDKRAMLLAGNRRGVKVPLKEADGPRGWRTRWVNCYCPRLFSAIRLPDPVLASRTIVVPLIRTPDRMRANADVLDTGLWQHARGALIDALWTLALAHLADMPGYDFIINDAATLKGRALEPWRGILAVALWLQDQGVDGLFERMNQLSAAYQSERSTLEPADPKMVVLRALRDLFEEQGAGAGRFTVSANRVAEAAGTLIDREELEIQRDRLTSARVGRILGQMRLQQERDSAGKRWWVVPREQLDRALEAHGLAAQEEAPAKQEFQM